MKRYEQSFDPFTGDPGTEMRENEHGPWVRWEDVEELLKDKERQIGQLEDIIAGDVKRYFLMAADNITLIHEKGVLCEYLVDRMDLRWDNELLDIVHAYKQAKAWSEGREP